MADNGIIITITGKPVAKGRGRSFARPGGGIGHYTPLKTRKWEEDARDIARQHMIGRDLYMGCLSVTVTMGLQIPSSWPQWKREAAIDKKIAPAGKPDVSNVAKAAEDALNGIVWNDDSQIIDLMLVKFYSDKPYVRIQVRPRTDLPASTAKKADLAGL